MPLTLITAHFRCDDCNEPFEEQVADHAMKATSAHDLAMETIRGFGSGSEYDGVVRCKNCTTKYLDKWFKEHPHHISGIHALETVNGTEHMVTTYNGARYVLPPGGGEIKMDTDVSVLLRRAAAVPMLNILKEAAAKFRMYAEQHAAKGTPEGDTKAETNRSMSERIEAVIAKAQPTNVAPALAPCPECAAAGGWAFSAARQCPECYGTGQVAVDG
jgi:hypothetical protein